MSVKNRQDVSYGITGPTGRVPQEPNGSSLYTILDEPGNYPEETVDTTVRECVSRLCEGYGFTVTLTLTTADADMDSVIWKPDDSGPGIKEIHEANGDTSCEKILTPSGFRRRLKDILWDGFGRLGVLKLTESGPFSSHHNI